MLGVTKLSKRVCEHLQVAVNDYTAEKNFRPDTPRPGEVKAALEEIQEKSKALISCLDTVDSMSLQRLQVAALKTKAIGDLLFDPRVHDTQGLAIVQQIHAAAKEALIGLKPDKGGPRRRKGPLLSLVMDLSQIFKKVTGSRAAITWDEYNDQYQGRFYDFVWTCLQIIDPDEVQSNSSLGQHIKRALKAERLTSPANT